MIKQDILNVLQAIPGMKERIGQFPLLGEKLETVALDIESTVLSLENQRPTYRLKPKMSTTLRAVVECGSYFQHYYFLEHDVNAEVFKNRPDLPEEEIIIGILPEDEYIAKGKLIEYWDKRGLEFVPHPDAYLDELMRNYTEKQLPEELKGIDIVAWSPKPAFGNDDGYRCHLYVSRDPDGDRELTVAFEPDEWEGTSNWAFILRKKK